MDQDRERRIRERAHAILEGEGRPEGRHEEHWRMAHDEVGRDDGASSAPGAGPGEAPSGAGDGGIASGLQPGGMIPGGGPGAMMGSIGTGGGSTAGEPSGSLENRNG
jgi:hypothetical protein